MRHLFVVCWYSGWVSVGWAGQWHQLPPRGGVEFAKATHHLLVDMGWTEYKIIGGKQFDDGGHPVDDEQGLLNDLLSRIQALAVTEGASVLVPTRATQGV